MPLVVVDETDSGQWNSTVDFGTKNFKSSLYYVPYVLDAAYIPQGYRNYADDAKYAENIISTIESGGRGAEPFLSDKTKRFRQSDAWEAIKDVSGTNSLSLEADAYKITRKTREAQNQLRQIADDPSQYELSKEDRMQDLKWCIYEAGRLYNKINPLPSELFLVNKDEGAILAEQNGIYKRLYLEETVGGSQNPLIVTYVVRKSGSLNGSLLSLTVHKETLIIKSTATTGDDDSTCQNSDLHDKHLYDSNTIIKTDQKNFHFCPGFSSQESTGPYTFIDDKRVFGRCKYQHALEPLLKGANYSHDEKGNPNIPLWPPDTDDGQSIAIKMWTDIKPAVSTATYKSLRPAPVTGTIESAEQSRRDDSLPVVSAVSQTQWAVGVHPTRELDAIDCVFKKLLSQGNLPTFTGWCYQLFGTGGGVGSCARAWLDAQFLKGATPDIDNVSSQELCQYPVKLIEPTCIKIRGCSIFSSNVKCHVGMGYSFTMHGQAAIQYVDSIVQTWTSLTSDSFVKWDNMKGGNFPTTTSKKVYWRAMSAALAIGRSCDNSVNTWHDKTVMAEQQAALLAAMRSLYSELQI